jgi:hypothetical protein
VPDQPLPRAGFAAPGTLPKVPDHQTLDRLVVRELQAQIENVIRTVAQEVVTGLITNYQGLTIGPGDVVGQRDVKGAHLASSGGGTPTITNLLAGATATFNAGSGDSAGSIAFTAPAGGVAAGTRILTLNFARQFTNVPAFIIEPGTNSINFAVYQFAPSVQVNLVDIWSVQALAANWNANLFYLAIAATA